MLGLLKMDQKDLSEVKAPSETILLRAVAVTVKNRKVYILWSLILI